MTDDEFRRKWSDAEKAVQAILIGLENDTGKCIEAVEIDTREYANLRTDIFFEGIYHD